MALTRKQLSDICHASCSVVHEGFTPEDLHSTKERIIYWDYVWEDVMASGDTYDVHATYQVSVFSTVPHCKSLLKLRDNLRAVGIHPVIQHEFNTDDRVWHSFMAIDVIGDITETGD